jgi:hypothetical protein
LIGKRRLGSALTVTVLRAARLAVRFGGSGDGFAGSVRGRLARDAHETLVRYRLWERRFAADRLGEWRATRSLRPVRALRRGLNVQMRDGELAHLLETLEARRPCLLLVFGMGNDSVLWCEANRGGQTLFVEDDPYWEAVIRQRHPSIQSQRVVYGTRAAEWRADLARPTPLFLPRTVAGQAWDMVLVDGPAAYTDDSPGRVQSVLAARRVLAPGGSLLVHDCDRRPERAICDALLGHLPRAAQIGGLRHYVRRVEASLAAEPLVAGALAT